MPIYEFCCQSCQIRFEELVGSSDTEGTGLKCPSCESGKVNRLFSSFSFKSSGGQGPASSGAAGSNCGPCSKTSCAGCG
ncbi:MAG: zinc ribbon domain-containing protein [Thermoleophilia bacterium]